MPHGVAPLPSSGAVGAEAGGERDGANLSVTADSGEPSSSGAHHSFWNALRRLVILAAGSVASSRILLLLRSELITPQGRPGAFERR
jgi:hypothetical protein